MLADLQSAKRRGERWTTLVLLNDPQDAAYTQSGITSVTVSVYDESGASPTEDIWVSAPPTPAATFFDTLQTSDGWDLPGGFNFKHSVLPTDLKVAINGAHVYRVVYTIETKLHGIREVTSYVTVVA